MTLLNSSLVKGSFLITSKFFFRFSIFFIPTRVLMRHLGGIDLINCKCFATLSLILVIDWICTSLTLPSRIGLLAITFIFSMLQRDTRILYSVYFWAEEAEFGSVYSCQGSTNASGIATPIGTWINLKLCLSLPPIYSATSKHFYRLK